MEYRVKKKFDLRPMLNVFWIPGETVTDIVIDKRTQTMVVDSDEGQYEWPVSTARKGINPKTHRPYFTPSGHFYPQGLERMHYSKEYDNSPMPYSIFFKGGFAIHGTPHVGNLGRPASHGCVRLHPQNARTLYDIVNHDRYDTRIVIR